MGNNENVPFLVLAGLAMVILIMQLVALRDRPKRRKDGYLTSVVWSIVAMIFGAGSLRIGNSAAALVAVLASAIAVVAYIGTKSANNTRSIR